MENALNIELRPRSLSAVFGQDNNVKSIRNRVRSSPPTAWMLCGSSGTGKTTIAEIMSVAYQCEHQKAWGDPCAACWEKRDGFPIHDVNASDATGIEDMRKLVEISRSKAIGGGKRVVCLDEFHKASNSAQNMLLKVLEKPSKHVVWILGSSEPGKIIDPIHRRCAKYALKPLGFSESEEYLKKMAARAAITRPLEPLFEQCHQMQVHAPGFLVQALDAYASGKTAIESVIGLDDSGVDALRIARNVSRGDWKGVRTEMAKATAESVRGVQYVTCGYLRTMLSKADAGERLSTSLLELTAAPFDENVRLYWLWATLYKICKRFKQ